MKKIFLLMVLFSALAGAQTKIKNPRITTSTPAQQTDNVVTVNGDGTLTVTERNQFSGTFQSLVDAEQPTAYKDGNESAFTFFAGPPHNRTASMTVNSNSQQKGAGWAMSISRSRLLGTSHTELPFNLGSWTTYGENGVRDGLPFWRVSYDGVPTWQSLEFEYPTDQLPKNIECSWLLPVSAGTHRVAERKFAVLAFKLEQNDTLAPVMTILQDDLNVGHSITWVRSGEGEYTATSTESFITDKTVVLVGPQPGATTMGYNISVNFVSATDIKLRTTRIQGNSQWPGVDGQALHNRYFEIKIYD